jgi:hypothetical protein
VIKIKTFEIWVDLLSKSKQLIASGTSPLGTFDAESEEDAKKQLSELSIKEIELEYFGKFICDYQLKEVIKNDNN